MRTIRWGLVGCIAILLLNGCSVYRYVPESKILLDKNKVALHAPDMDPSLKRNTQLQLQGIIAEKPNTKVLGLFRTYLWYYYRNQKKDPSKWYNRFVQSNLAELPVYIDSSSVAANLESMMIYLQNRGYYQTEGSARIDTFKHNPKGTVYYTVNVGAPMKIRMAQIITTDSTYIPWMAEINKRTYLKPGQIISSELYNKEVSRITSFLRNKGFAFFYSSQISPFKIDVADTSQLTVPIILEIYKGEAIVRGNQLAFGNITVHTDISREQPAALDTIFQGIHLRESNATAFVKPEVLRRAMEIKRDSLYREDDLNRTNRRLSRLGIYKFVNIRSTQDTTGNYVDLDIQLTPTDRFPIETGFEVSNTTAIGDNSNVLGLSFHNSIGYRNFLRNAILVDFSLVPSFEMNLNPFKVNALNSSTRLRFQFPFFEDYFYVWEKSLLRRWYPQIWNDARSQAGISHSYSKLLSFWETNIFNVNYGFEYNPSPRLKVTLDHFQIDYYSNILDPSFRERLPQGTELFFQSQLLSGFLFRSIYGTYNTLPNRFGETWTFRGGFEQSGIEVLATNELYRLIDPGSESWKIGSLPFAKYVRGETQWVYARNFGKGRNVATRLFLGGIIPFGDTPRSPYLKQFSVGGPSSLRGWLNGQIGPGSFQHSQSNPPYFQRGDIKLEFNAEWRQNIFWILESAVFVDAGNVWNLIERDDQPGGSMRNFLNEWAISTGLGFRLNFNFFILTYDVGIKVRYPYEVSGSHWAKKFDFNFQNLMINYPF